MIYISKSDKDTIEFAKNYAETLRQGDVVFLNGDLGAGKTVFAKGIVSYFSGDKEMAVSPTFTIVNEYLCNPPVYHFDFYRINSEDELFAIGIEEYLYGGGICLIEWPERAPNVLADINYKKITIKKDNDKRIIEY